MDFVLYDVENCQALLDFDPVKRNTECIFSKKSKLWGACDYDRTLSVGKAGFRKAEGGGGGGGGVGGRWGGGGGEKNCDPH